MRHVLIVDDDESERGSIADAFGEAGFTIDTAANGAEALEHVLRRQPDVIVLDLRMPVMDGYALLDVLQRDVALCEIPVIVCTGAAYDARLARAVAFVRKPCRATDLVMRARTWARAIESQRN